MTLIKEPMSQLSKNLTALPSCNISQKLCGLH